MIIVYPLTLEVIGIFQILTVFNTGERSEPEKFDYKQETAEDGMAGLQSKFQT